MGTESIEYADVLIGIGDIYKCQKEYGRSLHYYEKSVNIYKKIERKDMK